MRTSTSWLLAPELTLERVLHFVNSSVTRRKMEEDFFDVPDAVERVVVARRDLQRVLLQWNAPQNNNRCITCLSGS